MTPHDWHALRRFLRIVRLEVASKDDPLSRGYHRAISDVQAHMTRVLWRKRRVKKAAWTPPPTAP